MTTFGQDLVHGDLVPPDGEDPSDVSGAQPTDRSSANPGARSAELPAGVEELLHVWGPYTSDALYHTGPFLLLLPPASINNQSGMGAAGDV